MRKCRKGDIMPELANVNGRICAIDEAVIPAEDRGVLFGDGVYEVLRCYQGRLWAFARHFKRFERSLREIAIQNLDLETISRWVVETYEKSAILDGTVYFHVTRGVGTRSHVWSDDLQPTFFMTVRPFAARGDGNERGIRATSLPDLRWRRCDIKSLNLLPNVMAKQQARSQGSYEAILVDERGQVREGTSSAVFCIIDGTLWTAPDGPSILPSITGQFVSEIAKDLGIPVRRESFSLTELYSAEEAFIAGTGDEIMGITSVDGNPIATGEVGERTRRIYQKYRNRIARNQDE
jgi:D-alanine transaminase